jgi:hypothetical protein
MYSKFLDMLITLREVSSTFRTYSANDVKKLLASTRNKDLRELYLLEAMIAEIRIGLQNPQSN